MSLRSQIIRLAHANPELRPKLLPLLKQARLDADQERMFDALKMIAENEGRFYAKRDAKGAVDFAWRQWQKDESRRNREDFSVVKPALVKALADQWKQRDRE